MKLLHSLGEITDDLHGGAVSIGNFDGVHCGHAKIVETLRAHASALDGPSVVFTFDPHPVRLLRPDNAPPPLTWTRRKAQLLGELGINALVAYPTDEALLKLSAEDFFQQIIAGALQAKAVVEGPNFHFGHGRRGNVELLQTLCERTNIQCSIVQAAVDCQELVSSSRIRGLLRDGHVQQAIKLLGRPYRLRGMVTHGAQRGSKLGFPTANLAAIDTLIPGPGVYAGKGILREQTHSAAINVGHNPTFGESVNKVEVHLLDFDESIYGEPLEVDFIARLRDIQPFPSQDALQQQLHKDVAETRQLAG